MSQDNPTPADTPYARIRAAGAAHADTYVRVDAADLQAVCEAEGLKDNPIAASLLNVAKAAQNTIHGVVALHRKKHHEPLAALFPQPT